MTSSAKRGGFEEISPPLLQKGNRSFLTCFPLVAFSSCQILLSHFLVKARGCIYKALFLSEKLGTGVAEKVPGTQGEGQSGSNKQFRKTVKTLCAFDFSGPQAPTSVAVGCVFQLPCAGGITVFSIFQGRFSNGRQILNTPNTTDTEIVTDKGRAFKFPRYSNRTFSTF